jgi:hypothetical protein
VEPLSEDCSLQQLPLCNYFLKKKEPHYRPIYSSIKPEFFAKIIFFQQSIRKNDFVKIFTGKNFESEDIAFNQEEVSDNKDFVVLEFKRKYHIKKKRVYQCKF